MVIDGWPIKIEAVQSPVLIAMIFTLVYALFCMIKLNYLVKILFKDDLIPATGGPRRAPSNTDIRCQHRPHVRAPLPRASTPSATTYHSLVAL